VEHMSSPDASPHSRRALTARAQSTSGPDEITHVTHHRPVAQWRPRTRRARTTAAQHSRRTHNGGGRGTTLLPLPPGRSRFLFRSSSGAGARQLLIARRALVAAARDGRPGAPACRAGRQPNGPLLPRRFAAEGAHVGDLELGRPSTAERLGGEDKHPAFPRDPPSRLFSRSKGSAGAGGRGETDGRAFRT